MSKQKCETSEPHYRSSGRTDRRPHKRRARQQNSSAAKGPPSVSKHAHQPRGAAGHADTKQARIIAMLRTAGGATIEAMTRATGWQQHSVRGFLAGVVRKKLGLNLVSTAAEGGRVYRIADGTDADVAAKATHAA